MTNMVKVSAVLDLIHQHVPRPDKRLMFSKQIEHGGMYAIGNELRQWTASGDSMRIALFTSHEQAKLFRDYTPVVEEIDYDVVYTCAQYHARQEGWCDGWKGIVATLKPGPEEPTKVGAVVRSAQGYIYTRYTRDAHTNRAWTTASGTLVAWVTLTQPITILSEGVDL